MKQLILKLFFVSLWSPMILFSIGFCPMKEIFTLATWSGFWCSTPPWRRNPHGAPPDSVMTTSSATILLCRSSFFSCLFSVVLFELRVHRSVHWLHDQQSGRLTELWPALSLLRCPGSVFHLSSQSSPHICTNTCTHTPPLSCHPCPEQDGHHSQRKKRGKE